MTIGPEQETARPAPPTRRGRIVAAAAVLLLAVGGSGVYLAVSNSDEARVRRVVGDFAAAVDRQDHLAMLDLLCAEEAAGITEDDDYDPAAEPVGAAGAPEREVTDVRIMPGEQGATALMTTPGREPLTIHLRRERDRWQVCAPS